MKPEDISKIKVGDKLVWCEDTYEVTSIGADGACRGICVQGPCLGLPSYFTTLMLADQCCSHQPAMQKSALPSWSFKCVAADVDVRRCLREASAKGIDAVKITVGDKCAVFVSCRVFVDWVKAPGGYVLHGRYVRETGDPIADPWNMPGDSGDDYRTRQADMWIRATTTESAETWLRSTPAASRAPKSEPKIACKVEAL